MGVSRLRREHRQLFVDEGRHTLITIDVVAFRFLGDVLEAGHTVRK